MADSDIAIILGQSDMSVPSRPARLGRELVDGKLAGEKLMRATNKIYDAFVKYDHSDFAMVEYIVFKLQEHGLHLWFDRWSILDAVESRHQVKAGLSRSRSIIAFVGRSGLVHWGDLLKSAEIPVTLVLLPGAKQHFQPLRSVLADMSYVNFNDNFKASEKIAMLAARIEEFSSEELDGSRIVIRGKQHFAGSHFGLTRRTINAYDAIAEKFADTWFDHPPLEALELLNEQLPRSSTILDVGCGPGHHAQFFRRNGHEVAGIDLSREMLRVATARTRGIVYKQMDMRSLDFPRHSFDGLWCAGSAIHVPKEGLNSQLIEFKKILKPSGLLGLNLQIGRQSEIAADGRFFEFYESREEITSILTNVGFDIVNENYGETARNTHELELTLKWLTLYCRPAQSGHAGRADNNS